MTMNVGLIGVGGFGAAHRKAIRQLEAERRLQLVCVADPLAGVEGVRYYSDYREMLARETTLDAVAIAAPIHLHFEMTAAALARGLFVYLEKPPVPLISQLNELLALDTHGRVAVGFQLIHLHSIQQLKRWRAAGALGQIQAIRACGCSPRTASYYHRSAWAGKMVLDGKPVFDGPATNALSHWLHNIMYLSAERMDEYDVPVEIQAELYRARPIESYDVLCMRGRLESGATFHYAVTHATEQSLLPRLEIVGSKGRATITENGRTLSNNLGLGESEPPCLDPLLESWRQFVRLVSFDQRRAIPRLRDAQGYVLATNAALLSSGAIHDIAPQYVRTFGQGEDEGRDVAGLAELIERSTESGRLFSEERVGWSVSGEVVRVRDMRELTISSLTEIA
jgi:predicted dehydrogenase